MPEPMTEERLAAIEARADKGPPDWSDLEEVLAEVRRLREENAGLREELTLTHDALAGPEGAAPNPPKT